MRVRAAEFFAGMGLVRLALESVDVDVVWANDLEPAKYELYRANFAADHFVLGDVRRVKGRDIPDIDLAMASFPCTDLSLAGARKGLAGEHSGMFWEFARIIRELRDDERHPAVICLENVPSFATSNGGRDLRAVVAELNSLGYTCDLLVLDARRFVPQSRPRLFVVGQQGPPNEQGDWGPDDLRPAWMSRFVEEHPELDLCPWPLHPPLSEANGLRDVVQRLPANDPTWWDRDRLNRFLGALSPLHEERLAGMTSGPRMSWATAFRRTRNGKPMWEIRGDGIAGCLRTTRGGSAKQALVEAGRGIVRARWLTPRECARLQGVPDMYRLGAVTPNQALFGLGDAVCVPAVAWLARERLLPALTRQAHRATQVAHVG